ncbi:MAG: thiolase family protein [Chloroflexi bacterium]|nr:thiolase family protein [Dehalococcoidia bacterium]MCO5200358.1 thiolase family protein [Chloroflexota bacterium]MCZ7576080.1 thiolase family protein [Dehalococcoidia bacterium]
MGHPLRGAAAITGLGMTPMGRIYKSTTELAADATRAALADAGLRKDQVDGLLINAGITGTTGGGLTLGLQNYMGMQNLRLLNHMNAAGSTAAQMVQYAALAISAGMANHVLCVFADAPLREGSSAGAAYGGAARNPQRPRGMSGLYAAAGYFGANTPYALAARRHMAEYGTTQDQLGIIAVGQREWATMSPLAQMRSPITLEDYHNSRWIIEPLHLLDCCLVSNGAVAVVVSSAAAAKGMPQPPVYVLGMGQGHPGDTGRTGAEWETQTGAQLAARTAYAMAGAGPADIDVCQIYDCYTYTVLVTLEDYGFCKKGEGGPFVEDGKLGPGGSLPTNTGGGELSGYYMWGMTPLSEGIIQARGQGGERQVAKHDTVLVTGNGGSLSYHACLILSPHAN